MRMYTCRAYPLTTPAHAYKVRIPALCHLLGDPADQIASAQLASLPAPLVSAAIALAAAREELESRAAARDLCLSPWGSQHLRDR